MSVFEILIQATFSVCSLFRACHSEVLEESAQSEERDSSIQIKKYKR